MKLTQNMVAFLGTRKNQTQNRPELTFKEKLAEPYVHRRTTVYAKRCVQNSRLEGTMEHKIKLQGKSTHHRAPQGDRQGLEEDAE